MRRSTRAALQLAVVAGYYTDANVRAAIGYPGQLAKPVTAFDYPAYIEEGLIDQVLERGPIWRDPEAAHHANGQRRRLTVSSLQDVAALASVSTATVSRVLSGSSHPVAASTRQRVLAAVKELDFEPNMLASGLARSRTQVAAVIVHDVMDEYFSEIARGIEDEAYASGYVTMLCNTDRDPDKEVHYLRKLRALQVDAILFTAGGVRDPGHRAELDRQLAKVEAAGGVIVRLAPFPGGRPDIGYSNRIGLSLAVDHLVELGHGTIGYLAGPAGIATSTDRLAAMRQAMKRHGLALDPELIFDGGFSRLGGERAAAEFVGAGTAGHGNRRGE